MGPLVRRLLLLTEPALLAALFLEVYLYHRGLTLADRGGWGLVPLVFTPWALLATVLAAGWPHRSTYWLYVAASGAAVLLGVAGTGFHLAIHAAAWGQTLDFRSWLGNPPVLAPLSFALAGLVGLVPLGGVAPEEFAADRPRSPLARALYTAALVPGAAAAWEVTAGHPGAALGPVFATLAVVALAFGAQLPALLAEGPREGS